MEGLEGVGYKNMKIMINLSPDYKIKELRYSDSNILSSIHCYWPYDKKLTSPSC